ncbi:MAG TPA: response regulator transcription factor [Burkholderiales bacterium]
MAKLHATILIVDDDPLLRELLSDQLCAAGYRALTAPNGAEGLEVVVRADPDLVVLDVMMPGMSGWDVCERLRARSAVPIIMLTARDEEIDKLRAFKLGADDYVTVPCSFAEVVARIGAVLSRTRLAAGGNGHFRSGELEVDPDLRRVTVGTQVILLTAIEYRLLEALARRSPHPVCLGDDGRGGLGAGLGKRLRAGEALRVDPQAQDRGGSGRPAAPDDRPQFRLLPPIGSPASLSSRGLSGLLSPPALRRTRVGFLRSRVAIGAAVRGGK